MIQPYLKSKMLRSDVHIFILNVLRTLMVYILKHCALYFTQNIYAVVPLKGNEWGGDYWLKYCL